MHEDQRGTLLARTHILRQEQLVTDLQAVGHLACVPLAREGRVDLAIVERAVEEVVGVVDPDVVAGLGEATVPTLPSLRLLGVDPGDGLPISR